MDSEAELSLVIKARNLASREVDRLHAAMRRFGGGVRFVGAALKTLLVGGILGLIAAGAALVATLIGSTKAAADEQVGINRLNAALKANVKGHQAQKKGIEAVIAQREKLAFSDDDLRDSLTLLVTKYGDIAKAEKIQAVAMDVSRLKGISLVDATNLVTKAMDGSTKIAKQLGIEIGKHTTKQEILTAIQKKAAGQAEKYGKSAVGAQEAFGIALQDVIEDIGTGLTPVMTFAFTWLRTEAIPAIRRAIGAISDWIDRNKPLIDGIKKIVGQIADRLKPVLGAIADFITKTVIPAVSTFVTWLWGNGKGPLPTAANAIANVIDKVVVPAFNAIIDVLKTVIGWIQTAIDWFSHLFDNMAEAEKHASQFNTGRGTGFGPPGKHGRGSERGGMVGTRGPELRLVGEKGPEMILDHGKTMDQGGVRIQGVSQRELMDMVERGLYFKLQRAGTGS